MIWGIHNDDDEDAGVDDEEDFRNRLVVVS